MASKNPRVSRAPKTKNIWNGAIRRSLIVMALPIVGWLLSIAVSGLYSLIPSSWLNSQNDIVGLIIAFPLLAIHAIGVISIVVGPVVFVIAFVLLITALFKQLKAKPRN